MSKRRATVDTLTGNAKHREGKRLFRHKGLVVFITEDGPGFYVNVKPERGPKRWRVYFSLISPYGFSIRFAEREAVPAP